MRFFQILSWSGLLSVIPLFYLKHVIMAVEKAPKVKANMDYRGYIKFLLQLSAAILCFCVICGAVDMFFVFPCLEF
jgi:hypothetical protein